MPSEAELDRRHRLYPANYYGSNPALVQSELARYTQTHPLYFIVPGTFIFFGLVCTVIFHWVFSVLIAIGVVALVVMVQSVKRQPIIGHLRPAIVIDEVPLTYAVYEDGIWGDDREMPIVVIGKGDFSPLLHSKHQYGNVFPVYCTYSQADDDSEQDFELMVPNPVESVTTNIDEIESALNRLQDDEIETLRELIEFLPTRIQGDFYQFERTPKGLACTAFEPE